MAYQKQNFKNGNVLTAEQLNHMEDGIAEAAKTGGTGSADLPFGTDISYTEILPKETVTATATEGTSALQTDLTGLVHTEVGKKYRVTFDGVEYTCEAFVYDAWGAVCVGNGALIGASVGNGEPFCVNRYASYAANINVAKEGTHTVMIEEIVEEVTTIPSKYLTGEAPQPYMQLVTDGEGKAKWEDKLFGEVIDWTEFFDCFASGAVAKGKLANGDNYQIIDSSIATGAYWVATAFPVGKRTSVGGEIITLERVETEFAYADEADIPFSGIKLYDPSSDEFYLLAGEREIFGTDYACILCWPQDGYPPYATLFGKMPTNKLLPEKYLPEGVPVVPVTSVDSGKLLGVQSGVVKPVYGRIVFKKNLLGYVCNIPIEEFEEAVSSGLNASYVYSMDGVMYTYPCVSMTRIEYQHWEITIYGGDGTLKHTLEYTVSGLSETT